MIQYFLWFILYKTLFFNYWIEIIHICCWHSSLNFNCITSFIQIHFCFDCKVWIPSFLSSYANYSKRLSLTENVQCNLTIVSSLQMTELSFVVNTALVWYLIVKVWIDGRKLYNRENSRRREILIFLIFIYWNRTRVKEDLFSIVCCPLRFGVFFAEGLYINKNFIQLLLLLRQTVQLSGCMRVN